MNHLRRPTYTGIDEVESGFQIANPDALYTFSIWHSLDDIALQCVSLDPDTQKDILHKFLEQLDKAGNDDLLYLKYHPGDIAGYITKKTPVIAVTPFCLNEREGQQIGSYKPVRTDQYGSDEVLRTLRSLPETLDAKINEALDKKLAEILPEVEEEEEDPVKYWTGVITGVTQNPQVMAVLGSILNFLKPGQQVEQPQYRSVGNINTMAEQQQELQTIPYDENLMNESLTRLSKYINLGTDLKLLADLAEKDQAYFNTLLGFLRK